MAWQPPLTSSAAEPSVTEAGFNDAIGASTTGAACSDATSGFSAHTDSARVVMGAG